MNAIINDVQSVLFEDEAQMAQQLDSAEAFREPATYARQSGAVDASANALDHCIQRFLQPQEDASQRLHALTTPGIAAPDIDREPVAGAPSTPAADLGFSGPDYFLAQGGLKKLALSLLIDTCGVLAKPITCQADDAHRMREIRWIHGAPATITFRQTLDFLNLDRHTERLGAFMIDSPKAALLHLRAMYSDIDVARDEVEDVQINHQTYTRH